MCAQKRLGMRFSKPDIFSWDNRAETAFKSALRQYMPYFFGTCARGDSQPTVQGCSLYRRSRLGEQYCFIGNRLEIMIAFTPDQFVQLALGQRPPMCGKQSFETIPIIQRKIPVKIFLICERQAF